MSKQIECIGKGNFYKNMQLFCGWVRNSVPTILLPEVNSPSLKKMMYSQILKMPNMEGSQKASRKEKTEQLIVGADVSTWINGKM